jgi:hypothetical protein
MPSPKGPVPSCNGGQTVPAERWHEQMLGWCLCDRSGAKRSRRIRVSLRGAKPTPKNRVRPPADRGLVAPPEPLPKGALVNAVERLSTSTATFARLPVSLETYPRRAASEATKRARTRLCIREVGCCCPRRGDKRSASISASPRRRRKRDAENAAWRFEARLRASPHARTSLRAQIRAPNTDGQSPAATAARQVRAGRANPRGAVRSCARNGRPLWRASSVVQSRRDRPAASRSDP